MFRVELHQLLYVYAGAALTIILLSAAFYNFGRTWRERRAHRGILKCGLCAFQFRDQTPTILPRCPNCDALVERRPWSQL